MVNQQRLVSLFKQLCSINSPALHEAEMVAYIEPVLRGLGMEVSQDNASKHLGGNANNILAVLPATGGKQRPMFFSAHMDTVEPTLGLNIVERDGVIYSDGQTILGADDKAGLAALIEMVTCIQENNLPHGKISFVLSVAEEIGLRGASVFDCSQLDADFGYVIDASAPVGEIVLSAPSHDVFTMTITGRAAHAGMHPEQGISAIEVAAKGIAAMPLGRLDHQTTANIGVINGGSAINIVAEKVVVRGEARSRDVDVAAKLTQQLIDCMQSSADSAGAKFAVHVDHEYVAYHLDAEQAVIKVASAALEKIGIEPVLFDTGGGADANVYNLKGIPCTVLSCAMTDVHTHQESCCIDQLVRSAEWLIQIALSDAPEASR